MLCSVAAILAAFAVPAAAEVWKDGSGKFQVEAEFLGIRGTDLYLKKPNGMTIKVPLARLSAESQAWLASWPCPRCPPPRQRPIRPTQRPEPCRPTWKRVTCAVWDALPSSYQSDVNDLIHTFAANMDADVWRAGTGLVKKVIRVLKEKKEFILKQPALAQSPVDTTTMTENWDPMVGVLETIAASDLADLQKLKTLDVGVFLDGTGKKIAEQLAALAKAADDKKLSLTEFPGVPVDAMPLAGIGNAKFSTVKIEGDTATLRIENEGKTEDQEVVRVDGKWLPKKMVDQWSEQMQSAKTALTTQMPED